MINIPSLSIIIPCFNEEENINYSYEKLIKIINSLVDNKKIQKDYFKIIYIDDGSKDSTWEKVKTLCNQHSHVKGIKLSSNFGHQNAILSGLHNCQSDISISIDCDLQDNINVIEEMIDKYMQGKDIVYGIKKKRVGDSFIKTFFAKTYYKILSRSNNKILYNHADFRLLSNKIIKFLINYKESNIYLRGLVPEISSNFDIVEYDIKKRLFGKSKYSFSKMFKLGIDGITSFSDYPLRIIFILGAVISLFSLLIMIYYLLSYLIFQNTVKGWASIVLPIYFLGGLQLLCLSIIAQYVSKIFYETKKRPRYLIDKIINE